MRRRSVASKNGCADERAVMSAAFRTRDVPKAATVRIRDPLVKEVMARTDRALFIDASLRPFATDDSPLPIGHAQTTSQPFVIARMLEMLLKNNRAPGSVLEVGGGCGYQTALLSQLCRRVVSIERISALARPAAARLKELGYNNVHVVYGDGFKGHPAAAPFDGIIVCAEHNALPSALLRQLSPSGALVMPLSDSGGDCRLVSADNAGTITARRDLVRFVPLLEGKI